MVQRRRWVWMELMMEVEGSRMSSRRLVVAAAKIMAVQQKRWIRTELMRGAEGPAVAHERAMKSG